MKHIITIACITTLLFTACSPKTENQEQEPTTAPEAPAENKKPELPASAPLMTVDSTFQKQLSAFFSAYVDMKDALVDSDAAKVKEKIPALQESLKKIQASLLKDEAAGEWKNLSTQLAAAISAIEKAADLNQQREALPALTENTYKCVKAFGLKGVEAWYAYCPMALNDKGAYWLSNKPEIRNPYFGASMLNCGGNREHLR